MAWRRTATWPYPFERKQDWPAQSGFRLALAVVVLLGAGLRVYALDFQSFWTDEIFSLITTDPTLTFHEFWNRVVADTHPPIYYLVLRLSSAMFGQSEIAARAPSAFFGVVTLCGVAILPWSPRSRSVRLVFLLFLAISPGAVWYAREARSYGLLLLLSTGITLACVSFVRCPRGEDRKAQGAMVALSAFSVLASFTHYFGFLLAATAFLTCYLLSGKQKQPIVILASFGVVASFVPWAIYHSQIMDTERTTWIGKLPVAASLQWFEYLSFGGTVSLVLFSGTAAAELSTGGWRRIAGGNSTVAACTLLCLGTLVPAVAISLHTPILTSRNMIVVLPAVYLIAAEITCCLATHWGKLAGATYLAAQAGLMGQTVIAYHTIEINEQWRESAALVLNTDGCESGAIHVYGEAQNYVFFTTRIRPDLSLIEIPEGAAADLSSEPITPCPIQLWIVGIPSWDLDGLLIRLGLSRASSRVVEYHEAFVVLREEPLSCGGADYFQCLER